VNGQDALTVRGESAVAPSQANNLTDFTDGQIFHQTPIHVIRKGDAWRCVRQQRDQTELAFSRWNRARSIEQFADGCAPGCKWKVCPTEPFGIRGYETGGIITCTQPLEFSSCENVGEIAKRQVATSTIRAGSTVLRSNPHGWQKTAESAGMVVR
jgi:hypothetical protein